MNNHADTPTQSPFLTPTELAARWQVSTMTLRRWRKEGKLKTIHLGRAVRFEISEVQRVEREAQA
jgi:excisionase family DNA binding protein